jgi:hypothetical protein
MEMQRVASSSLEKIGYDAREHVLRVQFRNGGLYEYYDVPAKVWLELLAAESKGRYVNEQIKESYRCHKLAPASPPRVRYTRRHTGT